MPQVICTLPNASEEINGVKFSPTPDGMLSENVSDEIADYFVSIPGYKLAGEKSTKPDDAEREPLLARAAEIGFRVKGNWSLERLRSEVEAAEKAVHKTE